MYHIRLNIHIAKSDMMCQDWNNNIVTMAWPPHQLTSPVLDLLFWGMIHISCWWSSSRPFLAHREYDGIWIPTQTHRSHLNSADSLKFWVARGKGHGDDHGDIFKSRLPVKNWANPLVMTNTSPWYRWSIEIDGLPIKKWWFSMVTLNNQMVTSDHQKVMWLFPASPFLTTVASQGAPGAPWRTRNAATPRREGGILPGRNRWF